ncbi:MAG: hypothetical protein COT92_01180 [Candidatus Doudnabacteria bacterium CG10_big_fil_rev_8_21_14_0_10_42_18]|uniref:Clp R domain-containing protein n=1 Tax=Candidatus Doudnabacteria bacterium CG10_big_fil_rev_8_21_14_0_10_42_18 TaxID=1974552 RepID=A0A2H0VBG6_9BACT|nr:MAG: hypothetical protein COT92_01180 [Candidatus Doudnabacteria bacterium CG10_big_fil_rev_8_21_14_0_10_42_18]
MPELKYKKTNRGWSLSAQTGKSLLRFSGDFNETRIILEKLDNFFEKTTLAMLWLLVFLGLTAFGLNAYFGLQNKAWLFWLTPSIYNIIFWTAAFFACYLWAKNKQAAMEAKHLNILHYEENKNRLKETTVDIYRLFNKEAKITWNNAISFAKQRQQNTKKLLNTNKKESPVEVIASDLILSLLARPSIQLAFLRLGTNFEDIGTLVKNHSLLSPCSPSFELQRLPFVAFAESLKLHNKNIDPLMLLCALSIDLPEDHILKAIFFNIDLSTEKLEILASWIFNLDLLSQEIKIFKKLAKFKPENEINRGLTSVPTYYLDQYSHDLTWDAKHGNLPISLGRAPDLNEIFKLLNEGRKNLLIKGEAGTGRTTVINELAFKMVSEQVPKILQDKRLVRLEVSGILGSGRRAETIFIDALKEAVSSGNIVLVIEEIHMLGKTVSSSGLSLAELLVDFLQNHGLMVIGTTTVENHSDYLHDLANFDDVFTSYELAPLTKDGIILACCVRATLLEYRQKCFFRYSAIEQAVELTDIYLKNLGQPQKAISVLVEAATRGKNNNQKIIGAKEIENIISKKTHVPAHTFGKNEAEKLLSLEKTLGQFIVGQTAAVEAVAEGLRRARSGLTNGSRPLGSFMFLGPTGVGKTEVARVLAREYFGEPKYLLRLDMSEYQGNEGLTKLLGGNTGKTDSVMVKHLKNYPFCLLLLDEFEKAGPEIINLFLQILEDGRLTSGKGETLDLTHCMVIATSNAGTGEIQNGLKQNLSMEQIKQKLFSLTLANIFPPELLNRFDGIIVFSPLAPAEVEQIALLQLQNLAAQLLIKGVKLSFTKNVANEIAQKAFDPLLGARPVRRYIQDHVESFIAKLILAKKLPRGSNVVVDLEKDKLVIKQT